MPEVDTFNAQFVGVRGETICVMLPKTEMTKEAALLHAAWLVALADDNGEFPAILDAVRNT